MNTERNTLRILYVCDIFAIINSKQLFFLQIPKSGLSMCKNKVITQCGLFKFQHVPALQLSSLFLPLDCELGSVLLHHSLVKLETLGALHLILRPQRLRLIPQSLKTKGESLEINPF